LDVVKHAINGRFADQDSVSNHDVEDPEDCEKDEGNSSSDIRPAAKKIREQGKFELKGCLSFLVDKLFANNFLALESSFANNQGNSFG
jgi:hypothetical protein